MVKRRIDYREGTWFAVPAGHGFGVGVVARAKPPSILVYLFGPRRRKVPKLATVQKLASSAALAVMRIGDLGLVDKEWPIIGNATNWNRAGWPFPDFVRARETNPAYRIRYNDSDPGLYISAKEIDRSDIGDLQRDTLHGYGNVEEILIDLLDGVPAEQAPGSLD